MIALPLVALDVLVIALWTIAAALAIALIMNKLSSILAGVPWVGGKLSDAVKSMAQAITNACGHLLSGIDHLIGAAWSHLATYLDKQWNQFVAHSTLIAHLARIVASSAYRVTGLRSLVHGLSRTVHVVLHRFVTIGRELYHLRRRVKTLEHDVAKGIGADVLPRIKTLEGEVGTLENKVIPGIRAGVDAIPGELADVRTWVGDNFVRLTKAGLVAAVLTALGYLGLGGLNCNSLKNSLGKRACGFWSGLEDLLGLFVDTLLLTNVCSIIPFLETAVSDVADPIVIALTDVGAGLCSGGIGPPPTLHVPALSLPANPGVTLNLP